jgi:ABC-2 type transport system permease protein
MSNIYLFELKAQFKSFVIWTVSLLLVLTVFILGVYPMFKESAQSFLTLLENFPPQFAAAFGLADITSVFSFEGFYAFTFMYLSTMGAIMAASLSIAAFGREKRNKCMDFILTKPRKRQTIFLAKLLSNLTLLAATNILFGICSFVLYATEVPQADRSEQFVLAVLALFLTQLVFLAIGILIAVTAKKIRSVSGMATSIGFAGFILSALANMLEKRAADFFAPLNYFDPGYLVAKGTFDTELVITAAAIVVVSVTFAYFRFCRKDAPAA